MRLNLHAYGGQGAPILLVHGLAGNLHWWDTTAPLLTSALQPVALDFRGHGDSDWTADGVYTVEGLLEDIERARKELGWERMILCGHSLGARVSVAYARQHAERLNGLIAVDFYPEPYRPTIRKFKRARRLRQPVYRTAEEMIERFTLEPSGTSMPDAARRALAAQCLRRTDAGFTWKFDWRAFDLNYRSVWDLFSQLNRPTLIVRGELSPVMPQPVYVKALSSIPNAAGVEIAGAHHHVPLDRPRELADAILSFAASIG